LAGKDIILMVTEGCPGCEEAKKSLGAKVRVVDITKSDAAAGLVKELNIISVPTVLEIDRESGKLCITEMGKTRCVDVPGFDDLEL